MQLSKVYARFYKSFNYDHHRKAHRDAETRTWEMIGDLWYPYIEVPIDSRITTIVGANESGKSHLLGAIEKAISGEGFKHQDLCRYCDFFNVERGNEFWPHLGVAWSNVDQVEVDKIRVDAPAAPETFDSFLMFRQGPDRLDLYFPDGAGGYQHLPLVDSDAHNFGKLVLPRVFTIQSNVALPGALPTSELVEARSGPVRDRRTRRRSLDVLDILRRIFTTDQGLFSQNLTATVGELSPIISELEETPATREEIAKSYALARRLLLQLANVEPERLVELAHFIDAGENGHATALVESINQQLEKRLNFPKYWVQDRDFQLRVTALESDLVFTIRDRTGTQYTFDERSAGLKYFLSYFIQSQTHEPDPDRPEILLMDEPDAYLSAEAQQDLLKIFRGFAEPDDGAAPVQVVYVTHSPFLLDKNRAERIRVLQKGKGADGTRVIKNASQNHYEPLRSAFGAYVGETAFIGACNLLVEGVADQVLLAGISRAILRRGVSSETELLDLNRIVLVPCGSASHVPYMLYLIRGRDSDAPAVIVLLDSDKSGNEAAAVLRKDDKASRRLINPDYVMQFAEFDIASGITHLVAEPEDLLPLPLALVAANLYFKEVAEFREGEAIVLTEADVASKLSATVGIFDALKAAANAQGGHIDKIGLARSIVTLCEVSSADSAIEESIAQFLGRMKALFKGLNRKRRAADEERQRHRVKALVEQQRKIFLQDFPESATREQGLFLFERIADGLDHSLEAKAIRDQMLTLTVEFGLDGEANERIADYDGFKARLKVLKDTLSMGQEGRTVAKLSEVVQGAKSSANNVIARSTSRRSRAAKNASSAVNKS
ncbi:MAG: AAA family ATPase [Sphingomonas sp.]|uniref:AAA family ATPase n=1 Tax=Sphingomonas sp. TaxID=28214 RepID=UPI001ACC7FEF|nr:AAA family ATPase [Sphingomonas sp.]MBN8807824.1 AAA family ATPase [Sphingomonas sp.]